MMKGRTLYEEVWECRFPRRQTIEEELLAFKPSRLTWPKTSTPYSKKR